MLLFEISIRVMGPWGRTGERGAKDNTQLKGYVGQERYVVQEGHIVQEGYVGQKEYVGQEG